MTPGTEGGFATGGDRKSLRLHDEDVALIRSVSAANPRTIVAIVAGSAVLISEWDAAVPAVLQSWYAGMEGGHGLADVLLGKVDASGRLPFSVPEEESHLPPFDAESESFTYDSWHGYWHLARMGTAPAYPFGFGLSYSTFAIRGVEAEPAAEGVCVRAAVHNTGERDGSDVTQVYVRRTGSSRPFRLMAFRRVEVRAGETAEVEFTVARATLAERDTDSHTMVVRPGRYDVRVGRHAGDAGTVLTVTLA